MDDLTATYLMRISFFGIEFNPWTIENITYTIEFLWLAMTFWIYRHFWVLEIEKFGDFSCT